MTELIQANLDAFGPWAVFGLLMLSGIGVSLSEDLIVIPAGVLVGTGELPLVPVALAAWAGVVGSDVLWFTICHRWGSRLLHRRWMRRLVHPRRLLQAKHQIEQRGIWVVVMSRFIPGSRTTTITVAGLLHMPPWRFALVTALCVLVTVPIQLAIGVLIGSQLTGLEIADVGAGKWVVGGVALVVAVVLLGRLLTRGRGDDGPPPRAPARWLRRFRRRHRLGQGGSGPLEGRDAARTPRAGETA